MSSEKPKTNGQGNRLLTLVIFLMLMIVLMQIVRNSTTYDQDPYTMDQYQTDISEGSIESVNIVPNRETPTGYARVTLKDGTTKNLYTTDVTVAEKMARDAGLNPSVSDVPHEKSPGQSDQMTRIRSPLRMSRASTRRRRTCRRSSTS